MFLSSFSTGVAAIDDREYIDWKDYPNIVKFISKDLNYQTLEWESFLCTGTEIGRYVITAAHCVEGRYHFTIERNDGEVVKVELLSKGDSKKPATDWAILSLPTEVESEYTLTENITSDFGALYGFGALRILSDEEIPKIREYLYSNNGFNADSALKLLESDIPGIGYIYNDGDKLKMSHCSNIDKSGTATHALCVSSAGNSGGGLFINDDEMIGILSQGGYLSRDDTVFASIKPSLNVMQKLSADNCDEDFIHDIFNTRYHNPKVIRRIKDYYIVQGDGISFLTDSCGNVLLDRFAPNAKDIISLEHKDGQFLIEEAAPKMGVFVSGCDGQVQSQINKIFIERNNKIETIIYLINDDNTNEQISFDGGKTFYINEREAAARFLFTQQEFDKMPEDWKECLGIDK